MHSDLLSGEGSGRYRSTREEGKKKKMEGKKGPNSLHGRRVSLLDPSSVSWCLKTFMRRHLKTEKG
jgi:hypothetical protein